MASVFSTPIEPNSAPTSLIAVGRELEDGAGEQVRRGFSFSAAADWADTEPYHDGRSRSFVVDFVSLQENRSPIADLNHKGHEDHEGGCPSPPVDRFPMRAVHSSPSLLVLHSRCLGLVGRGLRGSYLRHGRAEIPGVSATGDWFPHQGDSIMVIVSHSSGQGRARAV
jgi:hypothetical protein